MRRLLQIILWRRSKNLALTPKISESARNRPGTADTVWGCSLVSWATWAGSWENNGWKLFYFICIFFREGTRLLPHLQEVVSSIGGSWRCLHLEYSRCLKSPSSSDFRALLCGVWSYLMVPPGRPRSIDPYTSWGLRSMSLSCLSLFSWEFYKEDPGYTVMAVERPFRMYLLAIVRCLSNTGAQRASFDAKMWDLCGYWRVVCHKQPVCSQLWASIAFILGCSEVYLTLMSLAWKLFCFLVRDRRECIDMRKLDPSVCMYVCVRENSWCGDDGKPARRVKGLDIRTHACTRTCEGVQLRGTLCLMER